MHTRQKLLAAGVVWVLGIPSTARAQHEMAVLPALPLGLPLSRLGSGTTWLPDGSPVHALHRAAGAWALMLHGAAFGEYDHQNGFRGDAQLGIIDWEMLMAARPMAGGLLRLSGMTSLEPLAVGASGYPELLQTGAAYHGARVVNRQHPNDLLMELSSSYDRALGGRIAASLYVAAVGEPSLGPVAYMHRPSSEDDPFAPLGHHWQDASHESAGVITVGVYSRAMKLEGSVFNGREPDEHRFNVDYAGARLDSYAGRLTLLPARSVSVAAWGGYLFSHDRLEPGIGMQRYGASILTSSAPSAGGAGRVSNAIVWGLNIHHHGSRSHEHGTDGPPKSYHVSSSVLVESSVAVTDRTTVFGRAEQMQKDADDLGFLGGDPMQLFTIRALSLGATRDVIVAGGASVGIGARGSVTLLPETLRFTYKTRTPAGFAVFLRLRPAGRRSMGGMGM